MHNSKYQCRMAACCAYHRPTYFSELLNKSLSLNEKYWRIFWEKFRRMRQQLGKKGKAERVIGLGRKTREKTVKWNQMTALRFQREGRHQTGHFGDKSQGSIWEVGQWFSRRLSWLIKWASSLRVSSSTEFISKTYVFVVAIGVGFFLPCEDLGTMFDNSFPASAFFFWLEISPHKLIPLFRPGSVHSGSASWDDSNRAFPDQLLASSFPYGFPHSAW